MRYQEAYQEDNTLLGDCTVGDIYPDMDLFHMDNQPSSPISRDLVESICGHQHTAQADEIDGEDEDEDETFLEYHSPDEDNISNETVMMTSLCISGAICEP